MRLPKAVITPKDASNWLTTNLPYNATKRPGVQTLAFQLNDRINKVDQMRQNIQDARISLGCDPRNTIVEMTKYGLCRSLDVGKENRNHLLQ